MNKDEILKWLQLGYETYGTEGAEAIAAAMGLEGSDSERDIESWMISPAQTHATARGMAARPEADDQVLTFSHDESDTSPNHRPRTTDLNGSPSVRLYFWEPIGKGESSFGHLSASVGNTMYSWGPAGMTVEPREVYLRRNRFRGVLERKLNLAPEEKRLFESRVSQYGTNHQYGILNANCADPAEEALEQLGYPMGVRLSPKDVQDAVVATGLSRPDDYAYHKAQWVDGAPAARLSERLWNAIPAPWSPLFGP